MRIVSLLPSATEIVCALGLEDELVGISHACDWPPEAVDRPIVTRRPPPAAAPDAARGGHAPAAGPPVASPPFELDEEALAAAAPELVLVEAGHRELEAAIRRIGGAIEVVPLEATSIEGIFNTISTVGAMTDAEEEAVEVLEELRGRLATIEQRIIERRGTGQAPVRVVGLEWLDPPFASGGWVPEQVRRAGGWDLLGREGDRSVETTWQAVRDVDPETIVLLPSWLHLDAAVAEWRRMPRPPFWDEIDAVRRGQVYVVDASAYISRPGPRVVEGIAILAEIFDPDGFGEISPIGSWTPVD